MTQYSFHLVLPFKPVGETVRHPCTIEVARYDSDPGWQEGDIITVQDIEWGWRGATQTFSFQAMILHRENQISSLQNEPRVLFQIEMADKEQIPRMIEVLKTMNPGCFENYPLLDED